jgi:DNA-binding response OmpR family regulator
MKKILFIEDEPKLQESVQKKLTSGGFTVFQGVDGKDGIEKAIHELPDLILLDIMLPGGMNGFDVLRELKGNETTKLIPVVMLTNLDSEMETAKSMGAIDYIIKTDISLENLLKKVEMYTAT